MEDHAYLTRAHRERLLPRGVPKMTKMTTFTLLRSREGTSRWLLILGLNEAGEECVPPLRRDVTPHLLRRPTVPLPPLAMMNNQSLPMGSGMDRRSPPRFGPLRLMIRSKYRLKRALSRYCPIDPFFSTSPPRNAPRFCAIRKLLLRSVLSGVSCPPSPWNLGSNIRDSPHGRD